MDWIKVKPDHILHEYTDLTDSEFRAWIKIMALTSQLEHEPTIQQMLSLVHHKTLKSLQDKLKKRSITLQDILKKVLTDVQEVVKKKEYWKNQKKKKRELMTDVHMEVLKDVQENSNNRLDKIRLDKINNKHTEIEIPKWIKKETWESFIEMRKIMRAKPTQKAIELLLLKLKNMKADGQDPNKVLEQSIENNWKGVFPVKTESQQKGNTPTRQREQAYEHCPRCGSEHIKGEYVYVDGKKCCHKCPEYLAQPSNSRVKALADVLGSGRSSP